MWKISIEEHSERKENKLPVTIFPSFFKHPRLRSVFSCEDNRTVYLCTYVHIRFNETLRRGTTNVVYISPVKKESQKGYTRSRRKWSINVIEWFGTGQCLREQRRPEQDYVLCSSSTFYTFLSYPYRLPRIIPYARDYCSIKYRKSLWHTRAYYFIHVSSWTCSSFSPAPKFIVVNSIMRST